MSEFAWYSQGLIHWQPEKTVDWLCVRVNLEESELNPTASLTLQEDSHHYFVELHMFDAGGTEMTEEPLDGPGPFEIPLQHVDRCVILAKVIFLGYQKSPVAPGQLSEVNCGKIVRADGTEEQILMQVTSDPKFRQPRQAPRFAGDALAAEIGVPFELPIVSLQLASLGQIPFTIRRKVPVDTRVYLLNEQELDAAIAPGSEVEWSALSDELPYVSIRAHQFAPAQMKDPATWSIALPIAVKNERVGLVGEPLAKTKLIADLEVETVGQGVWASWRWSAPKKWLKVRLSWDIYKDGEWGNQRDELLVTREQYHRRESVLLFERNSTLRGWYLEVLANPVLLKTNIPGQELSKVIRL